MKFDILKKEADKLIREAVKEGMTDKTIHMKAWKSGHKELICGYISPEFAGEGEYITFNHVSIKNYLAKDLLRKDKETMLEEALYHMNEEVEYWLGE